MKKILMVTGIIAFVLALFVGVALFLPNELHFKIANAREDFQQAKKIMPQWEIIPINNQLGKLYVDKQFQQLDQKISELSNKKCSLKNEKISEFCANIFYLEGLTQYQLGKDLDKKQQKPFFESHLFTS